MNFPSIILPSPLYVDKINIQKLLGEQQVYIVRRSDNSYDDTFNDAEQLRNNVLIPKDIPFLSLNLLGGHFQPAHSSFKIIKNGMERWKDSRKVYFIDLKDDYTELSNYCLIYLDANNIDDKIITCLEPQSKNLKDEFKKFKEYVPKEIGTDYEMSGTTKIIHDPIMLNYWHVEYHVIDYNSNSIPSKSLSKRKEMVCQWLITNIISINAFPSIENVIPISSKHYIKKAI